MSRLRQPPQQGESLWKKKGIRNACANAYAISTLMHCDLTNLWKLKMFMSAAKHNQETGWCYQVALT